MITGKAPVALHDVIQAEKDAYSGVKPRPLAAGSAAMVGVPVRVVLRDNGNTHVIDPTGFILSPHVSANPETGEAEQAAQLVFHVRLPPGYRIVSDAEEANRIETERLDRIAELVANTPLPFTQGASESESIAIAATRAAHGLTPESDPGVFATDPERFAEANRQRLAKPSIEKGGGQT